MAGRVGSLVCAAGLIVFFAGILGFPRWMVLAGSGLMGISLLGFYIQEYIERRNEEASHS